MHKPRAAPFSIETLRSLLRLDPETGKLYWRERGVEWFKRGYSSADANCRAWNTKYAGKEAFTSDDGRGYARSHIFGLSYRAHRIVFALSHGYWPAGEIDHIDGDPSNNKPANLREASRKENMRNRMSRRDSSSVYCGVSWITRDKRWRAACTNPSGKKVHLGQFTDEIEAARAYDAAAREWHGEYAATNFPCYRPQTERDQRNAQPV